MSRTSNPIFAVLITSGNSAMVANGTFVANTGVGQLGAFNAKTNLAVDNTSPASELTEIYFAVGIDRDGDTVTDDIIKSAGRCIQRHNVVSYDIACYQAHVPQVVVANNYIASCGETQGFRITITDADAFVAYGFQPFEKVINVVNDDCEGCEDCPSGDCKAFALAFRTKANEDPDGLFTVKLVDPADAANVDSPDLDAANVALLGNDACPAIQFVTNNPAIATYCGINEKYVHPRGAFLEISGNNLTDNVTIATVQDLVFEDGLGYDLKHKEFFAYGYTHGPYARFESGVSKAFDSFAVSGTHYVVVQLSADYKRMDGFLDYSAPQDTIIGIPCDDSNTALAVVDFLDTFVGAAPVALPPMFEAVNACSCANIARPEPQ